METYKLINFMNRTLDVINSAYLLLKSRYSTFTIELVKKYYNEYYHGYFIISKT